MDKHSALWIAMVHNDSQKCNMCTIFILTNLTTFSEI